MKTTTIRRTAMAMLCAVVALLCALSTVAVYGTQQAVADESSAVQSSNTLTVQYLYGGRPQTNADVKLYQIAGWNSVANTPTVYAAFTDGDFAVVRTADRLAGTVSGSTAEDWRQLSADLFAMLSANETAVPTVARDLTDTSGTVTFRKLTPGVYLVMCPRNADGVYAAQLVNVTNDMTATVKGAASSSVTSASHSKPGSTATSGVRPAATGGTVTIAAWLMVTCAAVALTVMLAMRWKDRARR